MIHSGSIIAAGISQGFSTSLKFDLNVNIFYIFQLIIITTIKYLF